MCLYVDLVQKEMSSRKAQIRTFDIYTLSSNHDIYFNFRSEYAKYIFNVIWSWPLKFEEDFRNFEVKRSLSKVSKILSRHFVGISLPDCSFFQLRVCHISSKKATEASVCGWTLLLNWKREFFVCVRAIWRKAARSDWTFFDTLNLLPLRFRV